MTQADDEHILELVHRWHEARSRGESRSIDEICGDRADLVPAVEQQVQHIAAFDFLDGPSAHAKPDGWAPGLVLNARYRLLASIDEGSHGRVWRARDLQLDRDVAIKCALGPHPADVENIRREAKLIAGLQGAHIVRVFDTGVHDNVFYFVEEWMERKSLAHVIEAGLPDPETAVTWIGQVAAALQASHRCGVTHRDVKPGNILVDPGGDARLADFGIALTLHDAHAALSSGTLPYKSPEQLAGRDVDKRSDIFSLGMVLLELLTGELPYSAIERGTIEREIRTDLRRRLARTPTGRRLPPHLLPVVRKALHLEPARRHATAAIFKSHLERAFRYGRVLRWLKFAAVGLASTATLLAVAVAIVGWRLRSQYIASNAAIATQTAAAQEAFNRAQSSFDDAQSRVAGVQELARSIINETMSDPFHAGRKAENQAIHAAAEGRLEDAVTAFTRAIECDPADGDRYDGRGMCLLRLGRLDEAVADLEKAAHLQPDNGGIEAHLKECHRAAGEGR